jgi:hypothetical protein
MHENFENPTTCEALVEDYMECLHHRKYVSFPLHRQLGLQQAAPQSCGGTSTALQARVYYKSCTAALLQHAQFSKLPFWHSVDYD